MFKTARIIVALLAVSLVIGFGYHYLNRPANALAITTGRIDLFLQIAKSRCSFLPEKKLIYDVDYSWDYTFEETSKLFNEMYYQGRTLPNTIYYSEDKKRFMLPISEDGDELPVPDHFFKSLIIHIETALKANYADYVFLADMGHAHFYIPSKDYYSLVAKIDIIDFDKEIFKVITTSNKVKALYHTAEMFLYTGAKAGFSELSQYEQFRNINRNLVGTFTNTPTLDVLKNPNDEKHLSKTFSNLTRVSRDIDMHANINGCFPFEHRGKIRYFDISRFSPALKPTARNDSTNPRIGLFTR